jgi:hypothetical protein
VTITSVSPLQPQLKFSGKKAQMVGACLGTLIGLASPVNEAIKTHNISPIKEAAFPALIWTGVLGAVGKASSFSASGPTKVTVVTSRGVTELPDRDAQRLIQKALQIMERAGSTMNDYFRSQRGDEPVNVSRLTVVVNGKSIFNFWKSRRPK